MARVLVIDDEPDVVRLIVKVLSGRGHVVQIAPTEVPLKTSNGQRRDPSRASTSEMPCMTPTA